MRYCKTITEEGAFHPGLGCSASLVGQRVQNLPAMDSLERKWLLTLVLSPGKFHGQISSILIWRIPRDRVVWRALVHWVAKIRTRVSRHPLHFRLTATLVLILFILLCTYVLHFWVSI